MGTERVTGLRSAITLPAELYQLGHEVLAVDNRQSPADSALRDQGGRPTRAMKRFAELGIASFDLVAVCVGERLETAVLLVHHLHQWWQLPRILVKVTNDEQAEIVQLVGATEVIQPEQGSARRRRC